jgi:hypothetical protein
MPVNIFTPNMPASGNSLGFTRPLVNANFANYEENLEVNHMGVNSADFGKHKFLTMPQQTEITPPTTSATEGGIYFTPVAGRSVAFVQRESYTSLAVNAGELGIAMYPLGSQTSNFTTSPNIIDVSTIVSVSHPNFWGTFTWSDNTTGSVYNGAAFIKYYNGVLSISNYDLFPPPSQNGVGAIASGTNIQLFNGGGAPVVATVKFTLTAYYYPT